MQAGHGSVQLQQPRKAGFSQTKLQPAQSGAEAEAVKVSSVGGSCPMPCIAIKPVCFRLPIDLGKASLIMLLAIQLPEACRCDIQLSAWRDACDSCVMHT